MSVLKSNQLIDQDNVLSAFHSAIQAFEAPFASALTFSALRQMEDYSVILKWGAYQVKSLAPL